MSLKKTFFNLIFIKNRKINELPYLLLEVKKCQDKVQKEIKSSKAV